MKLTTLNSWLETNSQAFMYSVDVKTFLAAAVKSAPITTLTPVAYSPLSPIATPTSVMQSPLYPSATTEER